MKKVLTLHQITNSFPHDGTMPEKLRYLCELGRLAPSVHNTQPWEISIREQELVVSVNHIRKLKHGDPTGRQTWISLGCFVENILLAGQAFGLQGQIAPASSALNQVRIHFESAAKHNQQNLENILNRHTNRAAFDGDDINSTQKSELQKSTKELLNTQVFIESNQEIKEQIATLTARAIAMALSLPEFKKELGALIRPAFSHKPDGIPAKGLGIGTMRSLIESKRFQLTRIATRESNKEYGRMLSSVGFIIVTTTGDVTKYWLEAGRAYERVVLTLTEFGFAHSTTAAVVEAPDFHRELEATLGTKNRIQAIIRYGHTSKKSYSSPRFNVSQLLQ